MRRLVVCLFAFVFYVRMAGAQSNLVLLISQSGDYIGQGQTYVTTNTASFTLGGSLATLSVDAFGYSINFDAPDSSELTTAQYTNASRWPFNGSSPGLSVYGNGRGCNALCGTFQIFELHTNGVGQIDRFWATFTQLCECGTAPMNGEIRYNSQLAPPAPVPKTLLVPSQYATIQAALDNTSPLVVDTIIVSPGTYNGALNFKGKRAMLTSAAGPAVTSIRAVGGTAVTFGSGETAEAMITGFTITNSSTAISVSSSSPTIVSNIIISCGTGIYSTFSSPTVRSNQILSGTGDAIYLGGAASPTIDGNIIRYNNAGISMFAAGSPLIRNNIIQSNRADGLNMVNQSDANIIQNVISGNAGSGIYWLVPSGARGPYVINNTITKNTSAGISADGYDASARIINNIVVGTPALSVGGFNDNNPPVVQYNDIYSPTGAAYSGQITNLTGVAGNISTNPFFACIPSEDDHLLGLSSCVDRGTNGAPFLPAVDFDGVTRILDGDSNSVATVDMGAFELNPVTLPVPCLYVTCPPNIVVAAAPGQNSAIVNYPAATGAPVATITSVPPSGSAFPGGTNVVTTTATYGTNSTFCTFTITVVLAPTITSQPQSTNILAGQLLSLSVGASGSAPFSYRWTFEGNLINGATASTLSIPNAQIAQEGIYRAVVSNSVGSVTSAVAFVRVLPSVPFIISHPASLTLPASSNASFTVVAGGGQPLGYQWLFNGNPISTASASQYSLSNIQSSNAGSYYVIVTNGIGSATSAVATLTVTPKLPYFLTVPVGGSFPVGTNVTLTGIANGSLPITYQWRRDGTNLAGATATSLALINLALSNSGAYTLVASNVAGSVTSPTANLVVFGYPRLQQGLTNKVVDTGDDVLLAISASASPTPGYYWFFNGTSIVATNSALVLSNMQPSQSGFYRVAVSNQYGTVSSTCRVSVLAPQSLAIAWGDNSGNQTNVPAGPSDLVAVSGGDYHSLSLHHNGVLMAWGYNGDGQTNAPTSALRFVAISAGANHNLAITESGSAVAWGRNDFGQCSVPSSASNNVLAVAAGESHSSALLSSGLIVNWGDNSFGQVSGSANLTGIRAIAAGRIHGLALRNNGTVAGWGYNGFGQASPPPALTNASAIAAGYLHGVALRSNGTVVAWGDNTFNQTNTPADLTNVIAIAAGDFHSLALRADGSIVGWGDGGFGQTTIPTPLTSVGAVASGYYHGLALISVPILNSRSVPDGMLLEWKGSGVLQWSPAPSGPYNDIPGLINSYTNCDFSMPAKFFRVRR